MKKTYLCTGNEACAEGALRAGCRFYAGYPITPQNELIAYMSRHMRERGGVFIQAESELSAVNMVLGASIAGARAMTSSSGPGISLKQEAISYIAAGELPAVIVNIMRGGPGLGSISPSQSDYFQAVKGGGHGDYHLIVMAPATIQEMFDFTYRAFGLADKYRNPVMILADGMIGQMMEVLEYDEHIEPVPFVKKDWALTGAKNRSGHNIKTLILGKEGETLEEYNRKLQEKYKIIASAEIEAEEYLTSDAQKVIVAYGLMSRIARTCVDNLRKNGVKAGLIRPKKLWPFPSRIIKNISARGVKFLAVEMSAGQMVEDVRLSVCDDARVFFYGTQEEKR
ncbi:pyruvate flavodoxin/ferredoxin oxidoreductase domain-containing protein [Candidatus Omnitrophus magneticus]|uniref:Pyruvate flavodoxin/ferredoxin oxidoreductase domain-containing protein n=1 Tax=Candidatus Omnitrophus magneticus TaxID=1609969 RepID=A0A0F0CTT4_9BACT|nr:pyruvate flavodoxin/ferredoxin oxidoreductase domain-containing protein [Candidatus Omnitrophus magneticus]